MSSLLDQREVFAAIASARGFGREDPKLAAVAGSVKDDATARIRRIVPVTTSGEVHRLRRFETFAIEVAKLMGYTEKEGSDAIAAFLFERARELIEARATIARLRTLSCARPIDDWSEEDGAVLWWKLPLSEPPYSGTPLDDDFPDYVTHWTPTPIPILEPAEPGKDGR
jgi:hypothetical protein